MISTVISKNGKELRLTAERWSHIVEAHDYMAGNQDLVFETLENPDYIVGGGQGEFIALKHYKKNIYLGKGVVVIYKEKEKEGFVITAFMTSEPERIIKKGVIWRK